MPARISRRSAIKLAGAGAALAAVDLGAAAGALAAPASGPLAGAFQAGRYTLPKLPYVYDALEPAYEARALRIHHTAHHAGYVRGLNAADDALAAARKAGDYKNIKAMSRALAFHGSGHVLHTLLWRSMTPGGSKMPPELARAMAESFGSVEACQAQFAAAAKAVEGSGWAVLAWEPLADRLIVLQAEKHQNLTVWGVTVLLVCDVWEHAYYLQYANRRADWVAAFMTLANWPFAADRLAAARKPPRG